MDTQKTVVDRIDQANNILVTVNSNPTVDQLAACIGLTVALNKIGKHATAVFSGKVPSTLEFLKPEETIEENTDSLRDFIISLDKSKADKLRYKVVDDSVVKIFITPYRTSITERDLEYSQGDFNVDVVVALGVQNQKELDKAITAHGRILHDATVITVNNKQQGGELGTIHWLMNEASSLSEMTSLLVTDLADNALDEQIATAFLTGIVSETKRFSNDKTTANTMNISASLITAGANQQLVANKLDERPKHQQKQKHQKQEDQKPSEQEHESKESAQIKQDGTLEIKHDYNEEVAKKREEASSEKSSDNEPKNLNSLNNTQPQKEESSADNTQKPSENTPTISRHYNTGGGDVAFTSATDPNDPKPEEHIDPLSLPPVSEDAVESKDDVTLAEIEKEVNSPHLNEAPIPSDTASKVYGGEELNLEDLKPPSGVEVEQQSDDHPSVEDARDAVAAAVAGAAQPPKALESIGAQPMGGPLHPMPPQVPASDPVTPAPAPSTTAMPNVNDVMQQGQLPPTQPASQPPAMPMPTMPLQPTQQDASQQNNSSSAPPVPPPIVPPFQGQ